jgi:hypothetical protein
MIMEEMEFEFSGKLFSTCLENAYKELIQKQDWRKEAGITATTVNGRVTVTIRYNSSDPKFLYYLGKLTAKKFSDL